MSSVPLTDLLDQLYDNNDIDVDVDFDIKEKLSNGIAVNHHIPEINEDFAVLSDIHSNNDNLCHSINNIDN